MNGVTYVMLSFDDRGLLPPGDYPMTLDQLRKSVLVYGPSDGREPMWHKYRIEFYPNYGQPFGAIDEHGHPLLFPSAFRRTRYSGEPKGIVRIIK